MRVALDVVGYVGACDQPQYGQIEDYTIVIKRIEDVGLPDPPTALFSISFPTRCAGSTLAF